MATTEIKFNVTVKNWAFWLLLWPQCVLTGDIRWMPRFAYIVERD